MYTSRSTVTHSRQLLFVWLIIVICIASIIEACHDKRKISKIVIPADYNFTKSIYYDLSNHRPFDIDTEDSERVTSVIPKSPDCRCGHLTCGCCAGINIDILNFDKKTCANVSFVPDNLTAQLDVSTNDETFFRTEMSGANPPPFCFPLYWLPIVTFCVRAHSLGIEDKKLRVCMNFETRIAHNPVFILKFRCFQMGAGGPNWYSTTTTEAAGPLRPANYSHDYSSHFINITQAQVNSSETEIYDDVSFEVDIIGNHTESSLSEAEQAQIGTLKFGTL